MHLRISSLCWAMLIVGLASAAQNGQRGSSDQTFDLDAETEGSADGEVIRDLEASGSGQGPTDDEDGEDVFNRDDRPPPHQKIPIDEEILRKVDQDLEAPPSPTEDSGVIMNPKPEDRPTSFFAQPGILAAVIGGAVVGLLCAILVVMFIVYRMRKKDEGSYALGEPKQSPNSNSYSRGSNSKEFYA